ncbi:MAG: 30S ribosomal protein S9 [Phycisphaerales bacterium]
MSTMQINSVLSLTPPGTPAAPVVTAPVRTAKPADKRGWWWGTGRRKSSVCRVRIRPASGDKASVSIIGTNPKPKTVEVYFTESQDRSDAIAALTTTGNFGKFEVKAKLAGGGHTGQAGAMRLAIARALVDMDPNLYIPLREAGFLTRDSRRVERKKYGQPGARRRFQFSKR